MVKLSRLFAVAAALAASAATTMATADGPPPEALAAAAAGLGQKALNAPAAFDFVGSLTTEIGQRLAGTDAHRRAITWAEARLKAAGFDNVHSEPFTLRAWIRGTESADIVAPVPQHLAITTLGGSVATAAGGIEAEIALFNSSDELLRAAWQRLRPRQRDPARGSVRGGEARRGCLSPALARHRQPPSAPHRRPQL